MKDQATNVFKSIQQFWKSQSRKQHITYLSIIAGLIVVAIILTIALNHKDYTVLYTNLDSAEASEILTEIQSMNIDATVKSDGSILVPKDQENSLRMQLATKGYPKSSLSYDIWNNNVNMFTTDSQKREIVKMQLQERLRATIKTLSGVEDAIVTMDIPESSNTVISSSTKKATASVVLHLSAGTTLSQEQINGISHIVMMSVSGLTEENISITDGTGKLLSGKGSDINSSGTDSDRLKFKNDLENIISSKLVEHLSPAYGQQGVKVSVNAVVNYDKKVTDSTKYTPSVDDHGMPQHEEVTSSASTDGTGGGTVGVEPNADGTYPTGNGTTSGASQTEYAKSTDYLVNTLKEQTEKNGYSVDKVNVAITVYKENLSDSEKSNIVETAVNTAGTTSQLVSVVNFPLYTSDSSGLPTVSKTLFFGYTIDQILIAAGVAFIILLIIIIVLFNVLGKSKSKKKSKGKFVLATPNGAYAEEQPPIDIKKLTDKPAETKEGAIRREIGEFAKTSPEIAAQLLKSWIREDGDK